MADNVIVRVPEQQFIRGEDGYSPEVTIENIEHGHSVTITDRDHPTGQSFNVMDGDSAYEQAVAGGYTGTEAQFNEELASFKSLSEETKDAAPFYAVYGQTTQAQIEAAINNKRQIYLLTAPLTESTPQAYVMPLTEKFEYQYTDGGRIVISRGYRFSITSGTNQYIAELANGWTVYTNDLTAPAQRAEAAADQALIRMNSADASAQAAATTATTFTEQTVPAAVNAINEAKADALTAVGNAQTSAVGAVQQESTTQQAAIQQKGEDVLDSIPSDYTDLSEDVDDLKSAFNADLVPTTWTPNITKGSYFKISNGATGTSNKYARTALWNGYGTRKAIAVDDPTYEFCLTLYDETGTSSGGGTGYLGYVGYTKGMSYIPQNATQFGVSFRRVDQAALTDEDVTAISAALSAFAATDTTLSVAGAPADAKTTGDMLSTAILEKGMLPANTDLNSLLDIGLYWIPNGTSVIPTLINYPSTNSGRLLVLSNEAGNFCTQIVITSSNTIFTRIQTNASQHTWSDWASYDGTTFRRRTGVKNEDDKWDANLILTNGNYNFNSSNAAQSTNLPSPYPGQLLVFAGNSNKFQIYVNRYGTIYYRTQYDNEPFSEWIRPLKADVSLSISGAAADAKAVGDAVRSGYVHDGDILRMSATPEAIPVNENHMGYNEFISTTWNTLLPTGYQEGDAYSSSTTKIHGVKVERASSWTSTPYGTNVDTYTIYRYIFTPQNGYDKTLFLTSGCHGNEAEGYWSLYRLVRMIYFEGHKYPTLRNLRDCRLIIVPSWNPWGFQHYRRYNAFESKNYQAWAWLMASNHEVTVNGTVYDISQVGEANVIWQTLQDYGDSINLWLDLHTDPYAGRDTSNVDIDDPRGVTPPYGCYGFSAQDSRGYRQLFSVMYDFYNILEDEYQFTETWHPQATSPGGSSFTGWMAQFGFPGGVVEVSTFMDGFPYVSGSAGMMKLAQEYYANCITEMLR